MDAPSAARMAVTDGPEPQGAANVVAFGPRQSPESKRARQLARQAAALRSLAKRRQAFDRFALAGQELLAELRAGHDPALAVAAFQRKVADG